MCPLTDPTSRQIKFFLHNSSLNTCRDRISDTYSRFTRAKVEHDLRDEPISLMQLDDILDHKMSHAIIDLPRSDPANRMPNSNLTILLNRKLCVKLFPGTHLCPCGTIIDKYWDHAFKCTKFSKTPMHNSIRDCLRTQLKTILPKVKLIDSPSMVLREPTGIVDGLPEL